MIRAGLMGFGVTLGLILIPLVHFVTALPSPFIGGFIAGTKVQATLQQAVALGVVITGLMMIPFLTASIVVILVTSWSAGVVSLLFAMVIPYVLALAILGAIFGGNSARKKDETLVVKP